MAPFRAKLNEIEEKMDKLRKAADDVQSEIEAAVTVKSAADEAVKTHVRKVKPIINR